MCSRNGIFPIWLTGAIVFCFLLVSIECLEVSATTKKRPGRVKSYRKVKPQSSSRIPIEAADLRSEININWVPKQRLHVFDLELNKIKELETIINCNVFLRRIDKSDYFYVTDFSKRVAYYKLDDDFSFTRLTRSKIPKKILANFKVSRVIRSYKNHKDNKFFDSKEGILRGRTNKKVNCLHITDDCKMYYLPRSENTRKSFPIELVDLKNGKVLEQNWLRGPWNKQERARFAPLKEKEFFIWKDKILVLTGVEAAFIDISGGCK